MFSFFEKFLLLAYLSSSLLQGETVIEKLLVHTPENYSYSYWYGSYSSHPFYNNVIAQTPETLTVEFLEQFQDNACPSHPEDIFSDLLTAQDANKLSKAVTAHCKRWDEIKKNGVSTTALKTWLDKQTGAALRLYSVKQWLGIANVFKQFYAYFYDYELMNKEFSPAFFKAFGYLFIAFDQSSTTQLHNLLDYFYYYWDPAMLELYLKKRLDLLKNEKKAWCTTYNYWKDLTDPRECALYIQYNFLRWLQFDSQQRIIFHVLKTWKHLDHIQRRALLAAAYVEKVDLELGQEIVKNDPLLCCVCAQQVTGPLFAPYVAKYSPSIIRVLDNNQAQYDWKLELMQKLVKQLVDFAKAEYEAGSIVLFHGQQSQWPFLEMCCNEVCSIKYGLTIPEDFVRMRFIQGSPLTDQEADEIRCDGVTYADHKKQYRKSVLFSNLNFFANVYGSNSYCYVRDNFDQTVNNGKGPVQDVLKTIFYEFGMYESFRVVKNTNAAAFEDLYMLYQKAVEECGNVGRFIAFSLPKSVAHKRVYSSAWGAHLVPITINGVATTDVVDIAENFDQVPYANEFCIILSKEICDQKEAKKAGVKIKAFDVLDRASAVFKKFEKRFKELMKQIAQEYVKENPAAAERIKRYIMQIVGVAVKKAAV